MSSYVGLSSCLVAAAALNCCLSLLNLQLFEHNYIIVSVNQSISLCKRLALKGSLFQIVTANTCIYHCRYMSYIFADTYVSTVYH